MSDLGNERIPGFEFTLTADASGVQQGARKAEDAVHSLSQSIASASSTLRGRMSALTGQVGSALRGMTAHAKSGAAALSATADATGTLHAGMDACAETLRTRVCAQSDQFTYSLTGLRDALASAFLPIYQAALPALNQLIHVLATAAQYAAALLSALFGGSGKAASGLSSAASAAKGLSTATRKAAKAAKGAVAPFDELNDLTRSSSGGGGGSGVNAGNAAAAALQEGFSLPEWMRKLILWTEELRRALAPVFETLRAALIRVRDAFAALWMALAPHLTPLLVAFGGAFAEVFDWICGHVTSAASWIAEKLAPGQPLGRAIAWITNFVSEHGAQILKALVLLFAGMKGLDFLGMITGFISSGFEPWALLIGAIAAAAALIIMNWDKIGPFFEELMRNIGAWFGEKIDAISAGIQSVRDWWDKLCKNVATWWHNTMTNIGNWFTERKNDLVNGVKAVGDWFAGIWKKIGDGFGQAMEGVKAWFDKTKQGFFDGIGKIGEWFSGLWGKIGEGFQALWNNVSEWAAGAFERIKDGIVSAFTFVKEKVLSIWDGIVDGIKGFLNKIIGGVNWLIEGINKFKVEIPSWVPGIGGKQFGINIPKIPTFA